jgi:hypothetical protein
MVLIGFAGKLFRNNKNQYKISISISKEFFVAAGGGTGACAGSASAVDQMRQGKEKLLS